jgi:hypothetical protein
VKEEMSKLLNKKVRIGKYNVPVIALLSLILVGSVLAVAYVTLQFTITANSNVYPKVSFWQWSGSVKANTFSYSLNIFTGVKTIDENTAYGIFNDDSVTHQCGIRVASLTLPSNIAALKIKIYTGATTILEKEWTSFSSLPTAWESFDTAANTKYNIWIEVTGASTPLSGSSAFSIELTENNP